MKRSKEQFLLFRIRAFADENAFALLLKEYGPAIQRKLHFKLPTQEDVEDAYTTVSVRFWQYVTTTNVDHALALLHTIAKGVIADYYRSRKGKDDVPVEDVYIDAGERIEQTVDARMQILQGLKQLNEEDREAISMRHIDGYSVKDIAAYLGKTENATSVLIHRAKKKLQTFLEK